MGDSAPDTMLAGIPGDSRILIAGPPMTGKYELLLRALAHHSDNVIVITTKNQASRVSADYREFAGPVDDDRIGVIDCVSHNETIEDVTETERIKYVGSPENLTRIGVKFTELFELFYEEGGDDRTSVGLHSLSQLLMHSSTKNVYQFLQVLTGQIRSAGWLGIAVIDSSVVDEQEIQTLHHHFDGVIETRENGAGQREFRIRGIEPTATDWTAF